MTFLKLLLLSNALDKKAVTMRVSLCFRVIVIHSHLLKMTKYKIAIELVSPL